MISFHKALLGSLIFCLTTPVCLLGQDPSANAIKIYVRPVYSMINGLTDEQSDRLVAKLTQVITETGVAEQGFSNFCLVPQFDTISSYVDDAGIGKIYTVECELRLELQNTAYSRSQHMIFASLSKRLTGSATRPHDAITNALGSLRSNDPQLQAFMQQSKTRITAYFQQHCDEVVAEAQQAIQLNDYSKAISLLFSIPSSAPAACYKNAQIVIEKTYKKYVSQDCNLKLLSLRAVVARALTTNDSVSRHDYDTAIAMIGSLDPVSDACYDEAYKLIDKIESRFDEQQRHAWQLKKKEYDIYAKEAAANHQTQLHEAISKISIRYQASVQSTAPAGSHL